MKNWSCALFLLLGWALRLAAEPPQTVPATWAEFDARAEALGTELIRETVQDGIVLRQLRYVVGTFAGRKTRVAALYAFPERAQGLPGIVQLHGGGQRAMPDTVRFWAAQGYAAIAVNWGEKVIGEEDDPNTDWAGIPAGFLDPKHHNDILPGEGTIHAAPHPWNSSWLLYAAAARRAITFLEQQPEADGERVGVTGHSMGGRLTVLTAIDPRVVAASPSVGGSGYLYTDITGIPGSARRMPEGLALYEATLDCRNYWPLIQCPLMFLGATNDFNSPMEKVVQGFRSLPRKNGMMSFTPHMNHRFTADNYAARVRWFETHLKGTFEFPKPPRVELTLDEVPRFAVWPDRSGPHPIKQVQIFYGYERDARVRFLRAANTTRKGGAFHAHCPVMDLGEPLFVFANITYDTGAALKMPRGYEDTPLLTITSPMRMAFPQQLKDAGVHATGKRQRLIEDFSRGWQDWSRVAANNPHHWNFETQKLNDPAWVGPRGASLGIELETSAPNETLAVVLETDQWRGYTGRKTRRYVALVELAGKGAHTVALSAEKFITEDGLALEHYDWVTGLILTPGQKERPKQVIQPWQGKIPTFKRIQWIGGSDE